MEGDNIDFTFDYDGENFTIELNGEELVGCQWIPKNTTIRYILIFFHGLGAFLSINRSFFPEITKNGGAIFGTDHLGHGRSPGARGNNTTEMLHDEISFLISRANILFPNIPVFVYGHSMGGLAILSYVMTHHKESSALEGIIVEAPWINTSEKLAGSIVHKIIGKFGKFILPSMEIDTGNGFSSTSYPQEFINKFMDSHLSHDCITPRLYASAFEMQNITWNSMNLWPKRLPLLFMQGGQDASVGVKANLKWCDEMRNVLQNHLRIVYHKNAEHAMLRKSECEIVILEVIDFINQCLNLREDLFNF